MNGLKRYGSSQKSDGYRIFCNILNEFGIYSSATSNNHHGASVINLFFKLDNYSEGNLESLYTLRLYRSWTDN